MISEPAGTINRAFDLRQSSDYQVIEPISDQEARAIVEKAQEFVAAVERYLESCGCR
jgi:uncharacterized protein (UPF0332 family)